MGAKVQAQKIAKEIKEKYPSLDVDMRERGPWIQVNVYGFHTLGSRALEARKELQEIGFNLGPNSGDWRVEKEEEIEIPHTITAKDAEWLSMTAEQRRDSIAKNPSIALAGTYAKEQYESGNLSDKAVQAHMYRPRYEAAKETQK